MSIDWSYGCKDELIKRTLAELRRIIILSARSTFQTKKENQGQDFNFALQNRKI